MSFNLFNRTSEGSRARRGLVVGAGLAVLSAGLTPLAASANPGGTGLVISEVYGGGGNTDALYKSDFVELYNPTDAAIPVNGWSLQIRAANSTGAGSVTTLSGSVPARGHYLVKQASGTGGQVDLPTPDATGSFAMSATGVQVWLASTTAPLTLPAGNVPTTDQVIDFAGVGSAAVSFETARTASTTNTQGVVRSAAGADTNNNSADFALAEPGPRNTAGATGAPGVSSVSSKSYIVDRAITPFSLKARGGVTPYSWSATGLPAGLSVDAGTGTVSGTPTAVGTSSVVATATDAAGRTGQTTFSVTVADPPSQVTPIAAIQGTGAATPLAGQTVKTRGVVTASYPTGGLNGFYIQTPGADTADASDAVFVWGGSDGFSTYPAVGDSVEVDGQATEAFGATQVVAEQSGITVLPALGEVTPKTQVPGTDCALPGTDCLSGVALDEARELAEGELFQPTAPWTATDVYDGSPYFANQTNNDSAFRGEIGVAANSNKPLVAPTEVIDAQATAEVADRKKYNDAHRITLDDASTLNFSLSENTDKPFPWFTKTHAVRVGAGITFTKPVIFTYGFNTWRIQPQSQVVGAPTGQLAFEQTRPAAPQDVGGDVKLATFNVLNFFPTTGAEFVSSGLGTCTYFTDRAGNPISNNSCNPNGPRGAANEANLKRQRDKIVSAITTADADIVSLEELENSVKFGKNRDFAINELVKALNAVAGPGTWAAVPSPAVLPPTSEQDVIRNGFIYQPANVRLVGDSVVLSDESATGEAFDDAREPVAQAFKRVGTPNSDAFAVIVNHFKSKGSGTPDPFGQGNATDRRMAQANSLVNFADAFKTQRGISRVFLAGDFNAYSKEDPIQVLEAAGYTALKSSSNPDEETYNFDGMVGSLDHVLANAAALADVNAVDIWDINGHESLYYEYARFNSNVTDLYAPNPFRSSDHSPEIVGINTADPATTEVQILATNDFHGRLQNNAGNTEAGAAVLAGAVKELRGQNPNTVFAAAGDLIGASTFESFIQNDKPTIDVLNEAGLEVSAAGNHEFDAGYNDLVNRVMAPYDAETNPLGGAKWKYIAANVRKKSDGSHALPESWIRDFGDVQVGFVGGVTEDLHALVSPSGIAELEVTSIVTEANATADRLRAAGADVVVLLVHEGAPSTTYASATDPSNAFGKIVNGVDGDIDAIVSGHTHLAYNHSVPVQQWIDEGRPVTERPVVSAGQYGSNLNKIVFDIDRATGKVTAKTQSVLALKAGASGTTFNYPVDQATKAIVDAAVVKAAELGARRLGDIAGPFNRAKLANGTTENRGGESTAGNLVAEVQRWATRTPEAGAAQIAFMNPGGLRADMVGTGTGYPRTLTYRQAAEVQPFANTLVNMRLTGAKIKTALEQQWQPAGASRPFLRLGISQGFTYTYDPSMPAGSRVTAMYLDGTQIDPAATYSVTVNSFLASGGDNFGVFAQGAQVRDTGKADLQAMVDYMAAFADSQPLAVDFTQRSVGYDFPADAPQSYLPGDTVTFDLSSLAFSTAPDLKDSKVSVALGGTALGEFPVDNTIGTAVFDEYGKATISVVVPTGTAAGTRQLTVTGLTTGSTARVPFEVAPPRESGVSGTSSGWTYGTDGSIQATVTPAGATGTVTVLDGDRVLDSAELTDGAATLTVPGDALEPGTHTLTLRYGGDSRNAPSTSTVEVTVDKIDSSLAATAQDMVYGQDGSVQVTVTPGTATGEVTVLDGDTVLGTANLSDGKATVTIPGTALEPGSHTLTVRYAGDSRNTASSSTVDVTVHKAESSLAATAQDMFYGQDGSVQVSVTPGTATGTVTVLDGDTVLGTADLSAGRATVTIGGTALEPGIHTLTVRYAGDSRNTASSSTVDVTVRKAVSSVAATAPDMVHGQNGAVRVNVSPTASTGVVSVFDGDRQLGSAVLNAGQATVTIPGTALRAGTHTLSVRYAGDDRRSAATSTVTLRVTEAVSTTDATITPSQVKVKKDTATITVGVTAAGVTPSGTVTAYVGSQQLGSPVALNGGRATLVVGPFDTAGTRVIELRYSGDRGAVKGSSDTVQLQVVKRAARIVVDRAPQRVVVDETRTVLSIDVRTDGGVVPTGDVQVRRGGEVLKSGRIDENGVVKLRLPQFNAVGEKEMKVVYLGDEAVEHTVRTYTFTVRRR